MATFLVDYENLPLTGGLAGVEYLNENDTLYIFYSSACTNIRNMHIKAIEKSNCRLKTYRLPAPGKNATDFCIATECGIACKSGEKYIAIISHDKGFQAIRNYAKNSSDMQKTVIALSPSIEEALVSLNAPEDAERRKQIKHRLRLLDIDSAVAKIEEVRSLQERITSSLTGTEFEESIPVITEYCIRNHKQPARVRYLHALHEFGRKDGLEIYRHLKCVV